MMCGLAINKGFVSVLCIGYFMVISYLCSIQMDIVENRVYFNSLLEDMDRMVYIEVLLMHRIKDSYAMKLNQDNTIVYDDYVITLDYEEDKVFVKIQTLDYEIIREYKYDSEYHYLDVNT